MSPAVESLLDKRNAVFHYDPPVANIDITTSAADWAWAVFAVMILSAILFLIMGHRRPVGERAFHELAAAICFTASIAYFSMASDLGSTPIRVEFVRRGDRGAKWVSQGIPDPTRSIWYVRYIDWTITTPLLMLELLLTTGLPLSQIFIVIFFDILMVVNGLCGALVHSKYKWGFYVFGLCSLWVIWYFLLVPARASSARLGSDYSRTYVVSTCFLSFLWILYPLAWGLCEGGNVVTPTGEFFWYGVLDLLNKPVLLFVHCIGIEKLDYARLGFSSGKVSDGALLNDKPPYTTPETPRTSMAPSATPAAATTGANVHPETA
ncbi:hypothetical protein JCM21900_005022 [Sporobolomyces salmonicolor]